MNRTKILTQSITLNAVIAAGVIADIITQELPSEYKRVVGIAFFEAANAGAVDYDLRVSDKNEVHQDFTTKYDYLSIIQGTNIKNVDFDKYYKPYDMPSQGNKVTIAIKHITGLAAGTLTLKVAIKVSKD